MKLKLITITFLSIGIFLTSCKKESEEPLTSTTPTSSGTSNLVITPINDTVDFSTTTNCSDWSIGMDFDSIHTDLFSPADFSIQSRDSNCVFTNNIDLTFHARNNHILFLDDNFGGNVKKYSLGQTINHSTVTNTTSSSSSVSARILEVGVNNSFNLNETFYLGMAFLKEGNYYNGWVKVKTLNNYHSCVVVEYVVNKTANSPITIQ